MKKIGFLYVKGSVPAFEDFGHLPTHLVRNNGMLNGFKAHKELDGLIIPGGSIIESQSVGEDLKIEILKMASEGKFVLGMCSGFQLLSNQTDIGRKSQCPIEKKGLGILDVSFNPMIGTDRVEAEVFDNSFLTDGLVGEKVTGFHCHTYGQITGDAKPVLTSLVKRTDYKINPREILSGVRNDEGNVVGVMVHGLLDENPVMVKNILKYIDANEKDFSVIRDANKELLNQIKIEIGVETGINSNNTNISKSSVKNSSYPKIIMMASTGSDSGKTFLTTGLVGVMRKKGYKVGVLKVGPDIRDIVPSLYLNKEKMERFSSIKIGGLGWKDFEEVLEDIKAHNYDIVIIEGVMSVFTGMLNEKIPFSSAEIAMAANIPVLMVSPCNKGGIETAAVDVVAHVELMNKLGINTVGIILNKVYDKKIAEKTSQFIKRTKTDFLALIPKISLIERGNIPEVEIKLEDFCLNAMKTVESYLDVDEILKLATEPEFKGYTEFKDILNRFSSIS